METTRKDHWEKIYETKQSNEVSWTQEVPKTSLDFIHSFNLPKSARIIDIGGGDSRLVDFLLVEGFEHIAVIDISSKALERAKRRLGDGANKVTWIVGDITEFSPDTIYDLWHDRATFHFLTTDGQIIKYLSTAQKAVKPGGYVIISTFSTNGPKRCSGLDVKRYSEETLTELLNKGFEKIRCITEDHITPFSTTQNFLFCSFRRTSLSTHDSE
jgi:ubiquinone/menaquinone biosynthesis C-methylase UbiE